MFLPHHRGASVALSSLLLPVVLALGLAVAGLVVLAVGVPATAAAPTAVDRAPYAALTGPATGITTIRDIATGRDGRTYGLQDASVRVFAAGAAGNAAPQRTITFTPGAPRTGFALTADADGFVTVLAVDPDDYTNALVLVFAPGASGAATPVVSRTNGELDIQQPIDVTDVGDQVAFIDNNRNDVRTYDLRGGATTPTRVIAAGSETSTRIFSPSALNSDRFGRLVLAGPDWVSVFAAGASGDVAPQRYLQGARTRLATQPAGVALDDRGNLFAGTVAYSGSGPVSTRVLRFAPGATGDVAPATTLAGSRTGLDPVSLFDVAPSGTILTYRLDPVTFAGGNRINLHRPIGPYAVPGKPGGLKVTGKSAAARRTVSWRPAAVTSPDTPVRSYTVTVTCGGKKRLSRTTAAGTRSVRVTLRSFRKGRCTATVRARNAVGASPAASTRFAVRR